jgi:hypothetical protein
MLPFANTEAVNLHLQEISTQINARCARRAGAGQAGWHHAGGRLKLPGNINHPSPAAIFAQAEPRRERLAISTPGTTQ